MSLLTEPDLNEFLSGHFVLNQERQIIFGNRYIYELSHTSEACMLGSSITNYITKASLIFMDSYIYPLLMNDAKVQEVHITWLNKQSIRIPVVINITLGENGLTYWSLYVCKNRDKLQNELLKANKKLEKQTQEQFILATTDPLTGLLNRRELEVKAKNIIYQTSRSNATLALLTIDVDYFKAINDTYGHLIGDEVLIELAGILTENRRLNDVVARVGGEEFIIILSNIDDKSAFLLVEKLREKIENYAFSHGNITVSIGLAYTSKNQLIDYQELLKISDNALYHSKNSGRNMTTCIQYSST